MGTNPCDEFPLLFYIPSNFDPVPPEGVTRFQLRQLSLRGACDEAIRIMQNKSTWIFRHEGRLFRFARNDRNLLNIFTYSSPY
jgi:hypothetical protein